MNQISRASAPANPYITAAAPLQQPQLYTTPSLPQGQVADASTRYMVCARARARTHIQSLTHTHTHTHTHLQTHTCARSPLPPHTHHVSTHRHGSYLLPEPSFLNRKP